MKQVRHLNESQLKAIIRESAKRILSENNFFKSLDKIKAKYYIQAKHKGLSGEDAKRYVNKMMSDFFAKDAALNDFSKDLHKQHPITGNYAEDEFYYNSKDMADSWGFETDPYIDDDEDEDY